MSEKGRINKKYAGLRTQYILLSFGFLFLVFGKCPKNGEKPVDFLPGDTCSYCKMHITEKKYAGEYILKNGKVKKFDDLGCLALSYLEEKENIKKVWVVDFETGEWLDAENSALFSSGFTTPMNYGFVAFERSRCKGECMDFKQFLERVKQKAED
ncbi:hypothetical protein HRbin19_00857 [bacterium HR19]|nr:hypothetical protein HRbin19_00857 [bacterium HR19]